MARITPVTAWTTNVVISAEPSVCSHEMSRGTLRNSRYLCSETSPERSSTQSSGTSTSSLGCGMGGDAMLGLLARGRRIEEREHALHGLARLLPGVGHVHLAV